MRIIIIDASVALKWWLHNESLQTEALAVLQDFLDRQIEIRVPQIFLPEICNILPKKISDPNNLEQILSELMLYKIEQVVLSLSLISLAFDLIREFSHISFYDASYHALALQEGGLFVTADKKYYEKTKNKGGVRYLGDYGK